MLTRFNARPDFTQRKLRVVRSNALPRVWLFTDTETRPFTDHLGTSERFMMGWAALVDKTPSRASEGPQWTYFDDEIRYNRYIEQTALKYKTLYLVGHNIYFDLQAAGFFYYFPRWDWTLKFYYDRGLTYILTCKKGGSSLVILSTTNWFDSSLETLGKTLGLEKGKVDFKDVTEARLKAYCKRDVEIIIKAVEYYLDFLRDHDLGKFSYTKSSQAFTTYRYRFMTARIYLHREEHVTALERAGYFGGRTEAFFIGQCTGGPFVSLDVNSMYPYVMKKYRYPSKLVEYLTDPDLVKVESLVKKYGVMAEVDLNTDTPAYAVRHNGKCIFPVGRFTTTLATEGLKYALQHNHIVRVHRLAVYALADLFTGYVDYFHALRLGYKRTGNKVMVLLCKYMENSLYGKFGQKGMKTDIVHTPTGRDYKREEVYNFVKGGIVTITRMMNCEVTQSDEGEGKDSFVAVAAHITENARFTLWEIMNNVGRQRVLYCDTDSVKIRAKDQKYLSWPVSDTSLGALKIEDRTKTLFIGGAKNYRTDERRYIKGIPLTAQETSPGTFTFDSFKGQSTHLRSGQVVGYRIEQVTRHLKGEYDKGIVDESGHVRPLLF